jgi:hypothetical protein
MAAPAFFDHSKQTNPKSHPPDETYGRILLSPLSEMLAKSQPIKHLSPCSIELL